MWDQLDSRYCMCKGDRRPGTTDTREWASHGIISTIRTRKCSQCGYDERTVELPAHVVRVLIRDGIIGRKPQPRLRFKSRRKV